MKHSIITIGLLALGASASAAAQTTPVNSTVMKPAVTPTESRTIAQSGALSTAFMASGPYKLGLHAQKKNNQPISTSDFETQTSVSRSGANFTITASDGMSLAGSVSGGQMHASGTASTGGTLTLSGVAVSGNGASGTFTAHDGSTTLTGTFAMYPGLDMGPNTTQKIRNYGDPAPGTTNSGGSSSGNTCGFWCQLKQWFGL